MLLSAAASLDGYIDDSSADRLLLSNEEDLDRVDEVRAGVDAILVGANTIRADDPRLVVRSGERRAGRVADGRPATPVKVTVTTAGDLDPGARFFTGDGDKIVYTAGAAAPGLARLAEVATVVSLGAEVTPDKLLEDLAGRGIGRLMVEGGGAIHTMFLTAGLVDELQLVYAPFFVGDPDAPRFVRPGTFPQDAGHPMTLAETRAIGNCVLLRYLTNPLTATG
ncbi:hypothetical protein GCM10009751_37950 [Myceligenerans crystallogenes]|uniref:Bacterial bifunctional deaminase-reductase C-terminal domain-containing protein n=1 Tax=Myceligenerans crystallogenes TaxID=316335 RepID=A0ABN2NMP8_9MICO